MAKNLDGIKKLNTEELKKYRKMVLDYIGEKDADKEKEQKNVGRPSPARRVDGIKSVPAGPAESRDKNRLKEAIKKQEKDRKKIKDEEKLYFLKKQQAEEGIKRREKLRLEEEEREEKRRARESRELERIKREKEIERIESETGLAKEAAAEKRRIERKKAMAGLKNSLKNKLAEIFYAVKRNFIYGSLFLIIFLAAGYLFFCFIILRFETNNIAVRAADIVPVPAAITSYGVISYRDFRAMKNNNQPGLSPEEEKKYLSEWIILRNLKRKYNLPVNASNDEIAAKFSLDDDFNQVGLSRIKKISELLKNGGEIEQLGKYADEYSGGAYYDEKSASDKFGQSAVDLSVGQTGGVIYRANGYYIIKKIDSGNGRLSIKYLFVSAKTMDDYLGEKLKTAKVFILAK